jgi:hypothetical protein
MAQPQTEHLPNLTKPKHGQAHSLALVQGGGAIEALVALCWFLRVLQSEVQTSLSPN